MKLLLAFLSSLLIFSGCSQIKGEVTHEYDEYLQQFNSDLVALGEQPIDFSETRILKADINTMGNCGAIAKKRSGLTFIQVSNNLPKFITKESLTILIYHEIGHCFFGQQHTQNSSDIMYEQHPSNLKAQFSIESQRLELVRQMIR
jgi:PBP1b-binding outer membrane lipoprotein LpoB